MKTGLNILPAVVLAVLFVGCKTQKQTVKAGVEAMKSERLHEQALQAFDERKFIVEAKEFFFPDNKPRLDYALSGYISLNGSTAVVQFFPVINRNFPEYALSNENLEDNSAIFTKEKTKRNGDVIYSMKVQGEEHWLNRKIIITLYHNSNQCHVQLNGKGIYEGNIVSFTGNAYPLNE